VTVFVVLNQHYCGFYCLTSIEPIFQTLWFLSWFPW